MGAEEIVGLLLLLLILAVVTLLFIKAQGIGAGYFDGPPKKPD